MNIIHFSSEGPQTISAGRLPALLADPTQIVWVDLTGPDDDDLRLMAEDFRFHPLAIEDTRNFRQRPKVEQYTDYLFLILNPVTLRDHNPAFNELDVFVGVNYVVTVHSGPEPAIDEAHRRVINASQITPSYLLYMFLDVTVDSYFPVLDIMEEEIERLGDTILTNPHEGLLNRLFELKSSLIDMWRVVWPQREILNNMAHHDLPFIDQTGIEHYLRDVSDHLMWVADMVSTFRDTLTSVMDLYMSAVSNRLNRVVNRLTVFTVVIGMLTVISGFYGMNFEHTWPPFVEMGGIPFVIGLMVSVTAGLLVVFKRLGWY
jgi:magnesium transporter